MANLTFNGQRLQFPGGGILNYIPPTPQTPVVVPYIQWNPEQNWLSFESTNLDITDAEMDDTEIADAGASNGVDPSWEYNGQLTIEFNVTSYTLIADNNPWINIYYGSSSSHQAQEITGNGTYSFDLGNDNHSILTAIANGDMDAAMPVATHFSLNVTFSAYTS